MKNKKCLPVFALYEEADVLSLKLEKNKKWLDKSYYPLITGLGKVNASMKLAYELGSSLAGIDTVVNLGTAGSTDFPPGTIVQCTSFYQRDMKVTGYSQGFTPFDESTLTDFIIKSKMPKKSKNVAMCSTGDSFVDDHMMTSWAKMLFKDKLVHDMESYALAKVCATYGKKFYSFKYISDAGEIKDWAKTLEKASKALSKFYVDSFLK